MFYCTSTSLTSLTSLSSLTSLTSLTNLISLTSLTVILFHVLYTMLICLWCQLSRTGSLLNRLAWTWNIATSRCIGYPDAVGWQYFLALHMPL